MNDRRFESIQPGKWPLDAEVLLYESFHALRSAIAPRFFTTAAARSRDRKKRGPTVALLRRSLLGSRSCNPHRLIGSS